jgi:iron complex outermembrane receptor protein
MEHKRNRPEWMRGASVLGLALALIAAAPAAAQDAGSTPPNASTPANDPAPAPTAGADTDANQLEEIVVTARKTAENLQTTPVSISSLSADTLAERNVFSVAQVANLTPNLNILAAPSNGAGAIIYLRGIGAIGSTADADPPVTIYVDGVVQPRPTGNAFDLPDVERIEVLRGPQGTLFGRNTTGGAISIVTSRPTEEFGGKAQISYGRYNDARASVVLNTGELGETSLKAKLTFQTRSTDGYIKTVGRGASTSAGYSDNLGLSLTLEGDLSDTITVSNRIDYNKLNALPAYQLVFANPNAATYFGNSPANGGPPAFISPDPQKDGFYIDPRRLFDPSAEAWSNTLIVTADLSESAQLKSITGYRELDQRQSGQLGGSALRGVVSNPLVVGQPVENVNPLVTPYDYVKQHQWSQELQLTGTIGDFSYATGLYYFDEHATDDITVITNAPNAAGTASARTTQVRFFSFDSRSLAAYGQLNWKPASLEERLELSGGLRYTEDKKDVVRQTRVNGTLFGPDPVSKKWDNIGWAASASYRATDLVMLYARAASAYRAGGYNATQIGSPPFDPEKAIAIEGGVKADLFDRRARLNATVFKTFYDDLQILQRDAVANTNFTSNAAKATYEGVELEGTILPGGGFQLDGSLGYVNPKYQEYIFRTAAGEQNLANVARFPLVAKWTWNVGAQIEIPDTGFGSITPRVEYSFRSSFFFQPIDSLSPNNTRLGAGEKKLLNARLTFADIPLGGVENLQLQFYGENLTNNRTYEAATDFSYAGTASFSRPRTYGVRLMAEF